MPAAGCLAPKQRVAGAAPPGYEGVVVLVCSDSAPQGGPASFAHMSSILGAGAGSLRFGIVDEACVQPEALGNAIAALGARKLVICCRNIPTAGDELLAAAAEAAIHPDAVALVDMASVAGAPAAASEVAQQATAQIRSAVARVVCADLEAPVHFRLAFDDIPLRRRSLLRLGHVARRPVASWRKDRCNRTATCRACAEACAYEALHSTSRGVVVDAAACTGCGACVAACPSEAISLAGASLKALEAVAGSLADDARSLGLGVAVSCSRSTGRELFGGHWLTFTVPSLEMVTVGWPLQFLAAGADVKLVACGEQRCSRRAAELARVSAALANHPVSWSAAPATTQAEPVVNGQVPEGRAARRGDSSSPLRLREPEATLEGMASLAPTLTSLATTPEATPSPGRQSARVVADAEPVPRGPQRLESSVLALGEVIVETAGCSGCRCCALACPTEALAADDGPDGTLILTFDPSRCPACGACVSSCPERAVAVHHVFDSAALAAGRVQVAEVRGGRRCRCCGRPLTAGLAGSVPARQLARSHPQLAERMAGDRCADCLLAESPFQSDT